MARRRRRNGAAFKYTAGDSLAVATFSRASSASYIDSNGVLQTASTGVARDGHYISGVRTLLLEGQRANSFLNSGTPATHTSPSLVTGSYTLWLVGTGSIAVAAGTATITGAGTATAATPVTFTVTVAGTVTFTVTGSPTRAQCENGAFASSYIATAGSAVTRSADSLVFPWLYVPQAATFYADIIDLGTNAGGGGGVFSISSSGNAAESWHLGFNVTNSLTSRHSTAGGGTAQSTGSIGASSIGARNELRSALNPDGSTVGSASINGGTETVLAASGANAFTTAFSAPTLYLNGFGLTSVGFVAFRAAKIALGVQSLVTMRGL